MSDHYLPALNAPVLVESALEQPFWDAAREHRLTVQRCEDCGTYRWGPEWICHQCRSWKTQWVEIAPRGRIYSWERCWHPTHPTLRGHVPYLAVLVELPEAGSVRMIGNLLGDPMQEVMIGSEVAAVFEDHAECEPAYTLVQWRAIGNRK